MTYSIIDVETDAVESTHKSLRAALRHFDEQSELTEYRDGKDVVRSTMFSRHHSIVDDSTGEPVRSNDHDAIFASLLARVGQALYGDRWQSDLARALSVGDRRVREWAACDRSIPEGIWDDLARLLRDRSKQCSALVGELL